MIIVVALRHKDRSTADKEGRSKARRLAKLRSSVEALRTKVRRDLRSSDPNKFLTALAVAVLDETHEDPVTARRKQLRFSDDDSLSVMMRFNREGARTSKRIANPVVVKALRDAYEAIEDDDDEVFKHDLGRVTADMVGEYLAGFGLSSEKLRGFNANREMQGRLAKLRSAGGELPRHGRSKQKVLRGEFEKALEATASTVGLDGELIRSKYLLPGLEASYLKDGSLGQEKQAGLAERVAARFAGTIV